jgi:CRISPR-associated protein Csx3
MTRFNISVYDPSGGFVRNRLPTLLIGGPPNAGKSVLFHSLSSALHHQNIRHYALRACPDGEGNWSQESDRATVKHLHGRIKG